MTSVQKELLDLPREILVLILDLLDKDSRKTSRLVCKAFKDLADDPQLWRHRYVHLRGEAQKKAPRHLLKVLKDRNPCNFSLDHRHDVPHKKLDLLIKQLSNLRSLKCTCCVAQYLAKHHNLPLLKTLYINPDLCKFELKGSCMIDLSRFKNLQSLHVDARLYYEESVSAIIQYVDQLTHLTELALRISKLPPDTEWNQTSIRTLDLHSFPNLQSLKLNGIPVDSQLFDPEINTPLQNLHKLDIGQISELKDWIQHISCVRLLRMELKPHDVNSALLLLRSHLPDLSHLTIQAGI
jgi:hypothetical protein